MNPKKSTKSLDCVIRQRRYVASMLLIEALVLACATLLEAVVIVEMLGLGQVVPGQSQTEALWTFVAVFFISGIVGSDLILLVAVAVPSQAAPN